MAASPKTGAPSFAAAMRLQQRGQPSPPRAAQQYSLGGSASALQDAAASAAAVAAAATEPVRRKRMRSTGRIGGGRSASSDVSDSDARREEPARRPRAARIKLPPSKLKSAYPKLFDHNIHDYRPSDIGKLLMGDISVHTDISTSWTVCQAISKAINIVESSGATQSEPGDHETQHQQHQQAAQQQEHDAQMSNQLMSAAMDGLIRLLTEDSEAAQIARGMIAFVINIRQLTGGTPFAPLVEPHISVINGSLFTFIATNNTRLNRFGS